MDSIPGNHDSPDGRDLDSMTLVSREPSTRGSARPWLWLMGAVVWMLAFAPVRAQEEKATGDVADEVGEATTTPLADDAGAASERGEAPQPGADDEGLVKARMETLDDLVRSAQFDAARVEARQLLQGALVMDASQRNHVLEALAIIHVARRRAVRARNILRQLLARDPDHRPEETSFSPAVQSAFARARLDAPSPVAVSLAPTLEPDAGRLRLSVVLGEQRSAVQTVHAFVQGPSDNEFVHLVLDPDARSVSSVPLPVLVEPDVSIRYYLQARSPSGFVLASLGDSQNALRLGLEAEQALSLRSETVQPVAPWKRWAGWTGAVVGVVGLVTVTVLLGAGP